MNVGIGFRNTLPMRAMTTVRYVQQPCDTAANYCCMTVYISHTPGAVFQARSLHNQVGANTERYVFGTISSARCSNADLFGTRHYSSCCGDIEHGKSAQGGVLYTVVYGTCVCCLHIEPFFLPNDISTLSNGRDNGKGTLGSVLAWRAASCLLRRLLLL